MRDEQDHDDDLQDELPVVDNLRVFQLRMSKERPVLRKLTPEDLERINALVAEFGVG